jgi:hypothetical protein
VVAAPRRPRPEAIAEITRLLRRSDLVKFARRPDDGEETRALLDDAARLAGAIAIALPPPPSVPAPNAAAETGKDLPGAGT